MDINRSESTVTWIADARRDLGDDLRQQLDRELQQAFVDHRPTQIIVKQRFRGFTDLPARKLIIAVEVQGERGSHASVVKIGEASEVRGDHDGWQSCAGQRGVSSRMFIAPQLRELSHDRAAIIYPDVYQYYFNNGRDDEPKELEVVVEQCVLRDSPTVASVERVLTQVFTEAYRCFYRDAQEDATGNVIHQGVSKSLRVGDSDPVLERWRQPEFLQLRRGAVWLTSGHRKPESLATSKRLWEANPNSAQAARDLLVSLEQMADVIAVSGAPDGASRALELQSQALQLALTLHQANPASASVGRTAAVSAVRTSQKAHAVGNPELAA